MIVFIHVIIICFAETILIDTNEIRFYLSRVTIKHVFGVSHKSDIDQAVQPHKMARGWKFRI